MINAFTNRALQVIEAYIWVAQEWQKYGVYE